MNDCKNNQRYVVVNTGRGRRSRWNLFGAATKFSLEEEVSVPSVSDEIMFNNLVMGQIN